MLAAYDDNGFVCMSCIMMVYKKFLFVNAQIVEANLKTPRLRKD